MPSVEFTSNLLRHLPTPRAEVLGATVRGALEAVFAEQPALRGYVLDDQGALRVHVAVFVDGRGVIDRDGLTDALGERSEVFVMQALSGG